MKSVFAWLAVAAIAAVPSYGSVTGLRLGVTQSGLSYVSSVVQEVLNDRFKDISMGSM